MNSNLQRIVVPAMADIHFHLRECGDVMRDLIHLAIQSGIDTLGPMPNTKAGLLSAKSVVDYINFAKSLVPAGSVMNFVPIGMVNEQTTIADIDAFLAADIMDVKAYPRFRTTQSEQGIRDYGKLFKIIKYGGERGMKFHFHPEHPRMIIDNRDAEFQFIPVLDMFLQETNAILAWEHATDARCAPFWEEAGKTGRFFLTAAPPHVVTNESESYGDVRSVCKPPPKTELDRRGIIALICKNYPWVMAASDCAFHPKKDKHVDEGKCACGTLTVPEIIPLYAHALDELLQKDDGADIFKNFIRLNAERFHGLPSASREVTLVREPHKIAPQMTVGGFEALAFFGGQTINWRIETN